MVCLIYLLLLAGDIELNPGPVPRECAPSPKRTCKPRDRFMADVLSNKTELLSMTFNNLTRVYGTAARTIKTWLKGLNACRSTVSPELVQWASELLTAPKDRFLADVCSSDKAELLLSMDLSDVTGVYGATERNVKLWLKGLCTMGSTVSPQLVQWASELLTSPKDRFLADILTAGDGSMLLSMNVSSMAVHYGVTRQTIRSWVNELKSGSLGESIPVQLRDWVHHMCVNPRQRFMSEKGSGVMSMSVTDLAAEYGVTESTVNTWLKAISQPATESADIPASMLEEIGTIPDQDSVVELARSFKVTERYVRKRIADRNRANFLDSGDVDLSDEEIAAKYGIRKASVTSWKAEADRMWYSWFAQVDFGQLAAQVQQPLEPTHGRSCLYPHCICCECAVILFECDVQWIDQFSMSHPYRATTFQGISFNLCVVEKEVSGQPRVGSCRHCASAERPEELHDDFGDLPDCIHAVSGFGESRRLALGSLFCSTFKPSNYSYVHSSGKMGFSMNVAHLRGMAGMLKFGDLSEGDITTGYDRESVLRAFRWLRHNNPLYNRFLAQLETLYGYFPTTQPGGLGNPMPLVSGNVSVESGNQLSAEDLRSKEGMFVLADPDENLPRGKVCSGELSSNVGRQVVRDIPSDASVEELCAANKLNLYDPDLEHKLFPHLYPHGVGGYAPNTQRCGTDADAPATKRLTLGLYIKMRLLHADPRWRHDRLWPFFAYDWLMKSRIVAYNLKCPKSATAVQGRPAPMSKNFLMSELGLGEQAYDRVGQMIPPKLPGTKSYWSREYLDLATFCERQGLPDYFITLTANDGWVELKAMLGGQAPHFRPVESTLLFMQKYRDIKDLLWGRKCIFGRATDHWQRIEFQNRGALHVHLLLWVDDGVADRSGKVVATVPRSSDEKALRAKVLKYQVHNCREGRCYKKGKPKLCKYGFPYKLQDRDCLSDSGMRYDYARLEREDARIVSYNKELLKALDGHINVQRVTQLGLVRYLVKYVSKVEPTFTTRVKESVSEVEKYFTTRLIGAPEVATTLLSFQIAGGTRKVVFLDTNLPGQLNKVLKPMAHIRRLEDESTDVFWDSFRDKYTARPDSLERVTYPEYLAEWEVFATLSKVPQRHRDRSLVDRKERVAAPRDSKVLPRWRFLTPLDGNEYYYQVLLLNVPFRSEGELISDPNASGTFKEECFLRNLVRQEEDALDALEKACRRNFSIQYIHRMAKMLILQNVEAQEAVNRKLRDMGLGDVSLADDSQDPGVLSLSTGNDQTCFLDVAPRDMERSDLLKLLGHNPVNVVKDEDELRERILSLTPSQLMTDLCDQQRLLFLTGPGGTGKSFLIHTVVGQLTYCQGLYVEVLATSGSAAYLLGGSTIHRFFRLDIEMKSRLELGTVDCSAVANTDVIIVDECSMMSAKLFETMHDLCCYATTDAAKRQLPFAGKSVFLCGDLFQLPAVESPQLYQSPLWNKFVMVELKENCRQSDDQKYGEVLNRIRTGDHTADDFGYLAGRVCGVGHERGVDCELTDNCTVLCSKNEHKDRINLGMLDSLPGDCVTLKSTDVDLTGAQLNSAQLRALDSMRGAPPAALILKVGARVVVTRNLDVTQGIVNGTIGNVENIQPNLITVRRHKDGELMCIQPIKHRIKVKGMNCIVMREQYPLILAWAVTVHRVQGMTLSTNVFVYLDGTFFANGQAYVALSRVKTFTQLHLLSFDLTKAIKVSQCVRGLYGMECNRSSEVTPGNNMPECTAADTATTTTTTTPQTETEPIQTEVSAAVSLPTIATAESLRYMLRNVGDNDMLTDYVRVMSQDIDMLTANLQYRGQFNLFTDRPAASDCAVSLHPSLLELLSPVHTTGDGNCFWNAVSILICGGEHLSLTLRFLTACALIRHRSAFVTVIEKEGVYESSLYPSPELRYHELLAIALDPPRWGENEHIQALSIALGMPIYVFNDFLGARNSDVVLLDRSLDCSQLQEQFRRKVDGSWIHMVYCSKELYDVNASKMVHEFDLPPLCIQLYHNHFTALMYKSESSLQLMPVLHGRRYRRI